MAGVVATWCCVRCFDPRHQLLLSFITQHGTQGGTCRFCGAEDANVILPSQLRPLFEPLLDLYQPLPQEEDPSLLASSPGAASLAMLLEHRFSVFTPEALPQADALVAAIFTDLEESPMAGFGAGDLWTLRIPPEPLDPSWTDQWQRFAQYLQHERRFVFDEATAGIRDPRQWLPPLLAPLATTLEAGARYYRGRGGQHPLEELGAPPPEQTPAGRANPRGIPFLYLSTDVATVIAELRPWKGQPISLATLVLQHAVRVVDLTQAPHLETPFGPEGGGELARMEAQYRMLERMDRLLSHPIDPQRAELEYLPTQYLTEIIRQSGYEGMCFRSAVGPGKNLVLFTPAQAHAIQRRTCIVTRIHYHWHATEETIEAPLVERSPAPLSDPADAAVLR